ncbi:hypothetical protein C8R41DRAFT_863762 [Lentinula lateritia]|uniref:Bacteriophage T5 Orf172 DNA-binding domain-containing protein n=1 Tax=Lentinula lateritia TaxID=40482 RepID=A0ABQ8VTS5_9AGAR|nr:hypothetical protein C8R41DRAFT_863762 [Lentinula lateritia]
MARCRTHQLQSLYRQQILRPISPSDGPGWIYVYIDNGNEFKIGMTKDFERRQQEWDRNCPCLDRIWFKPILAVNRRRVGCRVHVEKFVFAGHCRDIRRKILGPALRRALTGNRLGGKLVSIDVNAFYSALRLGGFATQLRSTPEGVVTHDGVGCSMKPRKIILSFACHLWLLYTPEVLYTNTLEDRNSKVFGLGVLRFMPKNTLSIGVNVSEDLNTQIEAAMYEE